MKVNKARFGVALAVALLSGCAQFPGLAPQRPQPVEPRRYTSNDILREADRQASRVRNGEIGRVEAADQLNRYRLAHVGHNPVDDNTFALYRALTVALEQNRIDHDQFRRRLHARLIDWQRRWPTMDRRPANPAFTNFLMTVDDLPPLQ